ncbi:MAG TPA: hypothetical protein VFX09_00555, partial [Burkholderiales bacterium]|nr:hypothetical protein [Burkholderiales bacterium]
RGWSAQMGGEGAQPRQGAPEPKIPLPVLPEEKNGAQGSGSSGGSSVEPAASPRPSSGQSKEDERRATERKNKAKQRPGYQEEAPMPRASSSQH